MSVSVARRWQAPEVVQTSSMDCGPAALKCLLDGLGIPVGYGRLREACQTDVDGTSIDTLEVVAGVLGLDAEQKMIPVDHLLLDEAAVLPAMVVVRQPDGATHFVVVWRRCGRWLQLMDPMVGRRWVRADRFLQGTFRHDLSVVADDWRDWAGSDDFLAPLRRRLRALGAAADEADAMIAQAAAVPHWFALGTLDASVRLVGSLRASGALGHGGAALRVVQSLCRQTFGAPGDIFRFVPPAYWSVVPDFERHDDGAARLLMRGVVLLRVRRRTVVAGADVAAVGAAAVAAATKSPELAAALAEPPVRPLATVWRLLREDGLLAPLLLAAAIGVAVAGMLVEAVLFRGLFDLAAQLSRPDQRVAAVLALLGFVALLLAIQWPIAAEGQRLGRKLETRLRMALLAKLPRLADRYFQSRPVSDMAERSHGIHATRNLPALGAALVQTAFELALTLAGIALIDAPSLPWALAVAAVAIAVPLLLQPLLNERDLRLRTHGAALHGFNLDALLGLIPIRSHRAQRAVARQHEALLVEWVRAGRDLLRLATLSDAVQSLACVALAAGLLVSHFTRAGGVTGVELLLVFWTLKLPAIGHRISGLSHQYPAQRNALLRLLEPLNAPQAEGIPSDATGPSAAATRPSVAATGPSAAATGTPSPIAAATAAATPLRPGAAPAIRIVDGRVVASGHTILDDVSLQIGRGEHVAIVGASGAGKSTLVGLLLGWHRLAAGTITVDGVPLDPASVPALRSRTAWVDPAVQLWNRSLADNLCYASDDAAIGRLAPVIDAADLRGVLQKLPEGLQTWLGEGGGLLSGGEGQRVRLARALLQREAGLVLLDEPFRGLDRAQRRTLLADSRRWWRHATLLCVTHDVAETAAFDRVLVVEHGRIVEDGSPAKLALAGSRYRALLDAQAAADAGWVAPGAWRRITLAQGRIDEAGAKPRLAAVARAVTK